MKTKTSLSDIPFAITDHRVLAKLGYNIVDTDGNLKAGLMRESSLRFLFGKYDAEELFASYNDTIQNHIMPKLDIVPNIHILDCTEIIEEICFGAMNTHDLKLSEEMIRNSKVLKPGDILIEDRGFIDRDLINFLKTERRVDTYVPLKSNMIAYELAVKIAQSENKWEPHPSRENQKITFVPNLKEYWWSDKANSTKKYSENDDVELNSCVVWDVDFDNYFVFVTTDMSVNAKQIIMTYELCPEIEEDYCQLKDFWMLEDFKSTKLNMITLHIIMVLFDYLFFQIYTMTPEDEKYLHKSLPVILKNYQFVTMPYLVFYAYDEFGLLSITEFAKIYNCCNKQVQEKLDYIFTLP
ncbi:MAG: transposase [Bacilli bacterium]